MPIKWAAHHHWKKFFWDRMMLWPFFLKGYQDFFCITLTFPNEKLPFTPIHKKVTFDQLYLVPKIPQKFQVSRNLEMVFWVERLAFNDHLFCGSIFSSFSRSSMSSPFLLIWLSLLWPFKVRFLPLENLKKGNNFTVTNCKNLKWGNCRRREGVEITPLGNKRPLSDIIYVD